MDQIGVDGQRLATEAWAFLIKREQDIAETVEHILWMADVSTRIVDPNGGFARLLIEEIDSRADDCPHCCAYSDRLGHWPGCPNGTGLLCTG